MTKILYTVHVVSVMNLICVCIFKYIACMYIYTYICNCKHYIYGHTNKGVKLVLFNDASRPHSFFHHWLLDIKLMVILTYFFGGNMLSPHRLLLRIRSKAYPLPDRTAHTTAFDGPLVDHRLERKITKTAHGSTEWDR